MCNFCIDTETIFAVRIYIFLALNFILRSACASSNMSNMTEAAV
jgi:hypothetical protein